MPTDWQTIRAWSIPHSPAWVFVAFYSLLSLLVASPVLGSQNFYSDDLAGHIALVLRMTAAGGDPWFYDRAWFSGFTAFEFYGFLPHWLTSRLLWFFGNDWAGATRAVHTVLVGALVLLPWSAWWFVRSWQPRPAEAGWLTAGGIAMVLALFLVVKETGVFAGLHYVVTGGVFGQVPGWVMMLLYLGTLGREWRQERAAGWPTAITFSLVMATHPLTAVGALLAGLALLTAHGGWRPAVAHGVTMVATSAWFWLPVVAWTSAYAAGEPHSGSVTIVAVLFDGWLDWMNGQSVSAWILVGELGLAMAMGASLAASLVANLPGDRAVLILVLLGLLVAGDEFVEAFSLGLHYSRIVVPLALVAGLAAIGSFAARLRTLPSPGAVAAGGVLLIFGSLAALDCLDSQPWLSNKDPLAYRDESNALRRLAELPSESRVYIEYPKGRAKGDVEPGKYLESRLWDATGLEAVNGLLIQSSQSVQYYTTVTGQLGAANFSMRPFSLNHFSLSDRSKIDLLRRNAVTHLVSSNEEFGSTLVGMDGVQAIRRARRYVIHEIHDPLPRLQRVSVPLVGYADLKGNLPFRFLDAFVEFREALSGRIRLVELTASNIDTVPVDAMILNVNDAPKPASWRQRSRGSGEVVPTVGFDFEAKRSERLGSRRSHHERYAFERVASYLRANGIERLLYDFSLQEGDLDTEVADNASFEWSGNGQRVTFSNLIPGRWYEFAYSAFPAWKADNPALHRGSAGHWLFRPGEATVTATYQRWKTGPVIKGWLLTILTFLVMALLRQYWPNWDCEPSGARVRA